MDEARAQGVIGGMYGDEGKGMMTCLLARQMMLGRGDCTVVRYNSSAQAGHTVETNGNRHIFHHFGSGAMVGASTHLGPRFVAHPMLFRKERETLDALGSNTRCTIDPRALITTPYDMLLNQAIEQSRGSARHGSCGIGFGETIERTEVGGVSFCVQDLSSIPRTRDILEHIRKTYFQKRIEILGICKSDLTRLSDNDALLEKFLQDLFYFSRHIDLAMPDEVNADGIVFEGAQGLALDEELGYFPHVTRSKTGIPYMMDFCAEAGIRAVDIHYGTRAYTTRHGAGPLSYEGMTPPPGFQDATNMPNDYQGVLRFAPLDHEAFFDLISRDLTRNIHSIEIRQGLWVSCLDQMGERLHIANGERMPTQNLPSFMGTRGAQWITEGWGADLEQWKLGLSN